MLFKYLYSMWTEASRIIMDNALTCHEIKFLISIFEIIVPKGECDFDGIVT